jgi:hypothetical protein
VAGADPNNVNLNLAPQSPTPAFPARREPEGVVFMFLGKYVPQLEAVKQKYPGGEEAGYFDERLQVWDFRAYYVPPDLLESYARQEGFSYPVVPLP